MTLSNSLLNSTAHCIDLAAEDVLTDCRTLCVHGIMSWRRLQWNDKKQRQLRFQLVNSPTPSSGPTWTYSACPSSSVGPTTLLSLHTRDRDRHKDCNDPKTASFKTSFWEIAKPQSLVLSSQRSWANLGLLHVLSSPSASNQKAVLNHSDCHSRISKHSEHLFHVLQVLLGRHGENDNVADIK